jgi:hypothetical protein
MPRPLFNPRKDLVPIVHEAGWAPGPVWTDVENLAISKKTDALFVDICSITGESDVYSFCTS